MAIPVPTGALTEGTVNRLAVREVIIDFFGSLVPGMVFILTAITTLGASLLAAKLVFVFQISPTGAVSGGMQSIEQATTLVHSFQLAWILLLVMGSYVVGYAFYRRDLRAADERSFTRLFPAADPRQAQWLEKVERENREKVEREGGEVPIQSRSHRRMRKSRKMERLRRSREDLQDWVTVTTSDCEFPYPRLRHYLIARGLLHLARMISWDGDEINSRTALSQSKNFINVLERFADHSGATV